MVLGIGTDIVDVSRFERWQDFSYDQMRRVFCAQELEACKVVGGYDYKMLAARFAVKEAFFKALSSALVYLDKTEKEFAFLFLCRHVCLVKGTWDVPQLCVDWRAVGVQIDNCKVDVSLSHEQDKAIAFVVLSRTNA